MDKFTMIRMVDSGDEDYPLIWNGTRTAIMTKLPTTWKSGIMANRMRKALPNWDYTTALYSKTTHTS